MVTLVALALASMAPIEAPAWTLQTGSTYSNDVTLPGILLRTFINDTQSTMSVPVEAVRYDAIKYCTGTSNNSPPWTTPFQNLINQADDDCVGNSGGGTVPALTIRRRELVFSIESGTQIWTDGVTSPDPARTLHRHDYSGTHDGQECGLKQKDSPLEGDPGEGN